MSRALFAGVIVLFAGIVSGCRTDDDDTLTGSGSLVPGFGPSGPVRSNPSGGLDPITAIALDDDFMYVAGYDVSPGNEQWRIEKRSLSTGVPSGTFGIDGVVTVNPSSGVDGASGIAIDSTSMYIVGTDEAPGAGNTQWRIEKRSLTTGALDPSFDTDGIIQSNPSAGLDQAVAIAIDGTSLYIAGFDSVPGNIEWRIEKRSLVTGALDTSFDGDGVVVTNPSAGTDHPFVIAINVTSMVVAGFDSAPGNRQWRVEKRSLVTGALDTAFDGDGIVVTDPSPGTDEIRGVVLDSSAIYLAGYNDAPAGNAEIRIEKRNLASGALETSFDGDGIITVNPSVGSDNMFLIVRDSTSLYAAGRDVATGNNQWRIEKRSLITGALDVGFDGDGIVLSNPSAGQDDAYVIAADASAIYVGGVDSVDGNLGWRIEKRSLSDGAADATFGTGFLTSNPSTGSDIAFSIAVDASSMYFVGREASVGIDFQWRIEKRSLATGVLDTGFDGDGIITVNPSAAADEPTAIAIDSASMYVVGWDSSPGNTQWRIEKRSLTTGALDVGFDGDGIVLSNPSGGSDAAVAIAIDSVSMYVAGFDSTPGDLQWRIEKRSLATGALDTGFDVDGIVTSNPSAGVDVPNSVAIDGASMFGVGRDSVPGDEQWRLEKRSLATGAFVTAFDGDGVLTTNPGAGADFALAVAIGSGLIYVAGNDESPGNRQWRIEARSATTGALNAIFDGDGIVTSNPSSGIDMPRAIQLDNGSLYVTGTDSVLGNEEWRLERRSEISGALDTGFDGDGFVASNPSSGLDTAHGLAVDSSFLYVTGADETGLDPRWRVEKRFK